MYNFYVLTNRPSDLVCVSDILSLFPFKSKIDSLIVALDRDLSGVTNGKMVELSPKAPQTESSKPNERFVDKLMHVRTLHYMSDKLLRNLFISLISLEQQVTFESK